MLGRSRSPSDDVRRSKKSDDDRDPRTHRGPNIKWVEATPRPIVTAEHARSDKLARFQASVKRLKEQGWRTDVMVAAVEYGQDRKCRPQKTEFNAKEGLLWRWKCAASRNCEYKLRFYQRLDGKTGQHSLLAKVDSRFEQHKCAELGDSGSSHRASSSSSGPRQSAPSLLSRAVPSSNASQGSQGSESSHSNGYKRGYSSSNSEGSHSSPPPPSMGFKHSPPHPSTQFDGADSPPPHSGGQDSHWRHNGQSGHDPLGHDDGAAGHGQWAPYGSAGEGYPLPDRIASPNTPEEDVLSPSSNTTYSSPVYGGVISPHELVMDVEERDEDAAGKPFLPLPLSPGHAIDDISSLEPLPAIPSLDHDPFFAKFKDEHGEHADVDMLGNLSAYKADSRDASRSPSRRGRQREDSTEKLRNRSRSRSPPPPACASSSSSSNSRNRAPPPRPPPRGRSGREGREGNNKQQQQPLGELDDDDANVPEHERWDRLQPETEPDDSLAPGNLSINLPDQHDHRHGGFFLPPGAGLLPPSSLTDPPSAADSSSVSYSSFTNTLADLSGQSSASASPFDASTPAPQFDMSLDALEQSLDTSAPLPSQTLVPPAPTTRPPPPPPKELTVWFYVNERHRQQCVKHFESVVSKLSWLNITRDNSFSCFLFVGSVPQNRQKLSELQCVVEMLKRWGRFDPPLTAQELQCTAAFAYGSWMLVMKASPRVQSKLQQLWTGHRDEMVHAFAEVTGGSQLSEINQQPRTLAEAGITALQCIVPVDHSVPDDAAALNAKLHKDLALHALPYGWGSMASVETESGFAVSPTLVDLPPVPPPHPLSPPPPPPATGNVYWRPSPRRARKDGAGWSPAPPPRSSAQVLPLPAPDSPSNPPPMAAASSSFYSPAAQFVDNMRKKLGMSPSGLRSPSQLSVSPEFKTPPSHIEDPALPVDPSPRRITIHQLPYDQSEPGAPVQPGERDELHSASMPPLKRPKLDEDDVKQGEQGVELAQLGSHDVKHAVVGEPGEPEPLSARVPYQPVPAPGEEAELKEKPNTDMLRKRLCCATVWGVMVVCTLALTLLLVLVASDAGFAGVLTPVVVPPPPTKQLPLYPGCEGSADIRCPRLPRGYTFTGRLASFPLPDKSSPDHCCERCHNFTGCVAWWIAEKSCHLTDNGTEVSTGDKTIVAGRACNGQAAELTDARYTDIQTSYFGWDTTNLEPQCPQCKFPHGITGWPSKRIYYLVQPLAGNQSSKTLADMADLVNATLEEFQRKSCLRFQQVGPDHKSLTPPDVPLIFRQEMDRELCDSAVGFHNPLSLPHSPDAHEVNVIRMGWCTGTQDKSTLLAMVGLALGLTREQQRPDASNYININLQNVLENKIHNVRPIPLNVAKPYDFDSVMHDRSGAYAIDRSVPTLTALEPGNQARMDRVKTELSAMDEQHLRVLYCNAPEPWRASPSPNLGGGGWVVPSLASRSAIASASASPIPSSSRTGRTTPPPNTVVGGNNQAVIPCERGFKRDGSGNCVDKCQQAQTCVECMMLNIPSAMGPLLQVPQVGPVFTVDTSQLECVFCYSQDHSLSRCVPFGDSTYSERRGPPVNRSNVFIVHLPNSNIPSTARDMYHDKCSATPLLAQYDVTYEYCELEALYTWATWNAASALSPAPLTSLLTLSLLLFFILPRGWL